MVAELARNADLPKPKVYEIPNDQPNAFATGRNPENSAVAATTGLLSRLTQFNKYVPKVLTLCKPNSNKP